MKIEIKDIEEKYDSAYKKIVDNERIKKRLYYNMALIIAMAIGIIFLSTYFIVKVTRKKKELQKELVLEKEKTDRMRQLALELTSDSVNNLRNYVSAGEELLQIYDLNAIDSTSSLSIVVPYNIEQLNSISTLAKRIGFGLILDSTQISKPSVFSIAFGDSIHTVELQTVCYILMRNKISIDTIYRDSTINRRKVLVSPSYKVNQKVLSVENVVDLNSNKEWYVIIGSFKRKLNAEKQKEFYQNKVDSLGWEIQVNLYRTMLRDYFFITIGDKLTKGDANRILESVKMQLRIEDAYIKQAYIE